MDATIRFIAASSLACMLCACDKAGDVAQPDTTATTTPVGIAETPAEQCDPIALVPTVMDEAKALGDIEIMSIDGTYTLRVRLDPDPVKLNEIFGMLVTVRNADGSPFTHDVLLDVDAAMPQHGHGMSVRPKMTDASGPIKTSSENQRIPDELQRRWVAQGMMLHMPGKWKIYIDITEGAITERASFDLEVH